MDIHNELEPLVMQQNAIRTASLDHAHRDAGPASAGAATRNYLARDEKEAGE